VTWTTKTISIPKGRTFKLPVRWESPIYKYARIATISNELPVRITTTDPHGILPGWHVAIVAANGPKALNAKRNPPIDSDYYRMIVVDANTLELDGISGVAYAPHVANSGYLQWREPQDLTGYHARMDIKDVLDGEVLHHLSDTNGGIVIDNDEKTIWLEIDAADTESLVARLDPPGVFDLEMISPSGKITAILAGPAEVLPEVTTTP
jgi:hypothetical protein